MSSGNILGFQQINSHLTALVTVSPILYNGTLFVGVSSGEEEAEFFLHNNETKYPYCSFIGNIVSLAFDRA